MSSGWSWYVIVLVVLNLAGCVWLLWWTGRRRPGDPAPEQTSHYWDGDLTEYNKPMPRWWLGLFYLTIVFSVGYLVYYPGMGAWAGSSGWTSANEHTVDKKDNDARIAAAFAPYAQLPLDVLAKDPAALRLGQSVFANHCAACHGADARGARGFPDLTDTVWHWGGKPEEVLASVIDGRQAMMPPLAASLGDAQAVDEVVAYVQSLSGQPVDAKRAEAGAPRFALCAACHGADGKGNALVGAPDLTDRYWLYGGDAASIRETLEKGRSGQMPAHGATLGAARARLAAAWAFSRSQAAQ